MIKTSHHRPLRRLLAPILLLSAIIVLALLSWIGNAWGWHINNLVSADGIRWIVSNITDNIEDGPIGLILLLMMAYSALIESGLLRMLRGRWTLKQRRALTLTTVVAILLLTLLLCLTFLGSGILLSPFGGLASSPLLDGILALFLVAVIILSDTFGYASGRFEGLADMIYADVYLIHHRSYYFMGYVLAAELCGCLRFAGLLDNDSFWSIPAQIALYLIPLI